MDIDIKLETIEGKLCATGENFSPIFVDFESSKIVNRIKQGKKKNPVVQALGLNKHKGNIIDTTAGFGIDSFITSAFGANVFLIERSTIMFQLLEDGLLRAKHSPINIVKDAANRMQLTHANSISTLPQLAKDILPISIYIDPMYPERKKSALGKANLRAISLFIGKDEDSIELLDIAKKHCKRTVVKRPKLAPTLSNEKPDFVIPGKSTRFDVYLNNEII